MIRKLLDIKIFKGQNKLEKWESFWLVWEVFKTMWKTEKFKIG